MTQEGKRRFMQCSTPIPLRLLEEIREVEL